MRPLGEGFGVVLGPLVGRLGRLGAEQVANVAPTWRPQLRQNREKIEAKIDQNFDASWDRIFEGFWWFFRWEMKPSWHQNGI